MKKKIVKFGHPVLRKQAQAVGSLTPEIHQLLLDLSDTLEQDPYGVGLCAPQINVSLKVFLIHQKRSYEVSESLLKEKDPSHKSKPFSSSDIGTYINPTILSFSEESWSMEEGCLSLPLMYGEVERPWEIKVQALDENFQSFEKILKGYEARIFLHENDHLNGVLFIDRLEKKARRQLENSLKEMKKRYKDFNKEIEA